jgi:hypothetical protein
MLQEYSCQIWGVIKYIGGINTLWIMEYGIFYMEYGIKYYVCNWMLSRYMHIL